MKKLKKLLLIFLIFGCTIAKSQTSTTLVFPVYSGLIKPNGGNEGGPLAGQSGKGNRGFYTFDFSVIPAGKTLLSAELVLFTNSSTNTPEQGNSLVGIIDTPTLSNNETVQVTYADANDGPVFCEGVAWKYSYNNFNFNPLAVSMIQGLIGKGKGYANFSFGFRAASTTIQSWNFHGYDVTTENVKPRLVLTFDDTNNFPRAKFSSDKTEILVGDPVQFTDQSENGPTAWAWDFDVDSNPGTKTSTSKSPSFIFTKYGEYSISLKVTNSAGSNTILKRKLINVYTQPAANFSVKVNASDSLLVDFKDLSTFMPRSWHWDFGDGSIDSVQHTSHKYAANGLYKVCLTVNNLAGDSTICVDVNLNGEPIGIGNSMQSEVEIYPNPFTDWINIDIKNKIEKVEIFNFIGKKIMEQNLDLSNQKIILSELKSGIYFLKITDENRRIQTITIVKKELL